MNGLPQTGIFALGTGSHADLELARIAGVPAADAAARVAALREPRTTISGVNLVTGFRPELWAAVAPDAAPPGVVGFDEPLVGPGGYVLPATQHDVVMWLTGSAYDAIFDLSPGIVTELADVVALANEMVGWPYHHDRDLTGFIGGTENPSLVEAMGVGLTPGRLPGEGGSILLLQQWEHDAVGWEHLPVATQEAIIGRGKSDVVELDPRPPTSARGPDRPGGVREDPPAQHRLGNAHAARNHLCGVQPRPAHPPVDAREHGRRRRPARLPDHRDSPAHRQLLRDPVSRTARRFRRRGPCRCSNAPSHRGANYLLDTSREAIR